MSSSCFLENATQEHDCVCRNTRPGNSANSTTWPNQSTVISVNLLTIFVCLYHAILRTKVHQFRRSHKFMI